ncbi:MAG: hypothetical protein QM773_13245 [Hyphomonadaceae bacterium]
MANDRAVKLEFNFARSQFKPQPSAAYPLQNQLSWQNLGLTALYYKAWYGYGLESQQILTIQRASNETVKGQTAQAVGPALSAVLGAGRFAVDARLASLFASGGTWLHSRLQLRIKLGLGLTLGAGVDGLMGQGSTGQSTVSEGFLLTGFEF